MPLEHPHPSGHSRSYAATPPLSAVYAARANKGPHLGTSTLCEEELRVVCAASMSQAERCLGLYNNDIARKPQTLNMPRRVRQSLKSIQVKLAPMGHFFPIFLFFFLVFFFSAFVHFSRALALLTFILQSTRFFSPAPKPARKGIIYLSGEVYITSKCKLDKSMPLIRS